MFKKNVEMKKKFVNLTEYWKVKRDGKRFSHEWRKFSMRLFIRYHKVFYWRDFSLFWVILFGVSDFWSTCHACLRYSKMHKKNLFVTRFKFNLFSHALKIACLIKLKTLTRQIRLGGSSNPNSNSHKWKTKIEWIMWWSQTHTQIESMKNTCKFTTSTLQHVKHKTHTPIMLL